MANVEWSAGIDHVSGALAKPAKKNGHSCGSYLIGTHREAETSNPDCTRIYVRPAESYERTTPVTQNELVARERFTQVAALVKARAKNLSTITTDQAAYAAQKDSPTGKKTWKAYLWYVCGQAYDAEHPQG